MLLLNALFTAALGQEIGGGVGCISLNIKWLKLLFYFIEFQMAPNPTAVGYYFLDSSDLKLMFYFIIFDKFVILIPRFQYRNKFRFVDLVDQWVLGCYGLGAPLG